jgi:branched-chain amino acid transport system permease protein
MVTRDVIQRAGLHVGQGARRFTFAVLGLAALAAPVLIGDTYLLTIATQAMVIVVFCLSWNLAAGFCGTKSLGHQAFFGIGAYVAALTAVDYGYSPWIGLIAAMIVAGLAAGLLGAVILRLDTLAFTAIGTLAFAEIVRISAANFKEFTRGELGFWGIPPLPDIKLPFGRTLNFDPGAFVNYYLLSVLIMLAVYASYRFILASRVGLIIRAIRDAPSAAQACGINLARYKLAVFIWGGLVLGLSGAFYAYQIRVISPSSVLGIDLIVSVLAMTVVGGIGTIHGPIVGAIALTALGELLRPFGDWRMVVDGAIIIAAMLYRPNGLLGTR